MKATLAHSNILNKIYTAAKADPSLGLPTEGKYWSNSSASGGWWQVNFYSGKISIGLSFCANAMCVLNDN